MYRFNSEIYRDNSFIHRLTIIPDDSYKVTVPISCIGKLINFEKLGPVIHRFMSVNVLNIRNQFNYVSSEYEIVMKLILTSSIKELFTEVIHKYRKVAVICIFCLPLICRELFDYITRNPTIIGKYMCMLFDLCVRSNLYPDILELYNSGSLSIEYDVMHDYLSVEAIHVISTLLDNNKSIRQDICNLILDRYLHIPHAFKYLYQSTVNMSLLDHIVIYHTPPPDLPYYYRRKCNKDVYRWLNNESFKQSDPKYPIIQIAKLAKQYRKSNRTLSEVEFNSIIAKYSLWSDRNKIKLLFTIN